MGLERLARPGPPQPYMSARGLDSYLKEVENHQSVLSCGGTWTAVHVGKVAWLGGGRDT